MTPRPMSSFNDVQESIKLLRTRGNIPSLLQCGDVEALCQYLGIEKQIPNDATIATLYGLEVKKCSWMPADRATLIDSSGKVIRIFSIPKHEI